MDPAMAIEVAAMSRQRALDEIIQKGNSEIQKFYHSTTMFITGASGFMGKQMIEKLLRSCQISKIFILLRPKKNKKIQERLDEMLQDAVFDKLRKMQPDFSTKLIPVGGDAAEIQLGISSEDWETLVEEVNVIYHMAATTRFDETLRLATMINVRGTREAMLLARECKNLKSFVHVSTAYTQALTSYIDKEVYEEFKPSPIPPNTLISLAESVEENKLNIISKSLIDEWPNTYTFAKAVAEETVRSMSDGLPVCIVRPGVVVASYKEPIPGWLDISCAYGASGIFIGIGLGVLHIMMANLQTKLSLVPCDYVNNTIISAGREASRSNGGNSTKIYNMSSSTRNPVTQKSVIKVMLKNQTQLATPKAIYYTYGTHTSNQKLFTFLTWFLHLIPAYFVDFICLLFGKERRLVKIYKKVYKMSNALSYFAMNTWLFDDRNTENLYKSMSKTDKAIFNFDVATIDWQEFVQIWSIGMRKYIIKDGLKGTHEAIKRQKWLRILHYVLSVLYFYIIWKVFSWAYYILAYFL